MPLGEATFLLPGWQNQSHNTLASELSGSPCAVHCSLPTSTTKETLPMLGCWPSLPSDTRHSPAAQTPSWGGEEESSPAPLCPQAHSRGHWRHRSSFLSLLRVCTLMLPVRPQQLTRRPLETTPGISASGELPAVASRSEQPRPVPGSPQLPSTKGGQLVRRK